MKLLTTTYSVFEADIITTKLRASGIEAFPHSREHMAQDALVGIALGGVRIMVHEDDYHSALEILNDVEE